MELRRFLVGLRSQIDETAKRLVRTWNETEHRIKSLAFTVGQTRDLMLSQTTNPSLSTVVENLVDCGVKLKRLERILKHEFYKPWEEVFDYTKPDPSEIYDLWLTFNNQRKDSELNNYFDAVNVVSYYSLLEHHLTTGVKLKPLLASGTSIVRRYNEYPTRVKIRLEQNEYISPVSPQYLSFATAVDVHAEFEPDVRNAIVEEGIRNSQNLKEAWRHLSGDIKTFVATGEKSVPDAASIFQLPSFGLFCSIHNDWYENLMGSVGEVFMNVTRSDKMLRESHAAAIISLLKSHGRSAGESSVESILQHTIADSEFDWGRSISTLDNYLLLRSSEFSLSKSGEVIQDLRANGLLVEDVGSTFNLDERADDDEKRDGFLRVTANLSLNRVQRTLFRWELGEGEEDRLCCWQHALDFDRLVTDIWTFLATILEKEDDIDFVYFSEDQRCAFSTNLRVSIEDLLDRFDRTAELEYVKVSFLDCVLFFDLSPTSPYEASEFAVLYQVGKAARNIGKLFEMTSVNPLDKGIFLELLKEYDTKYRDPIWLEEMIERGSRGAYTVASY